MLLSVTVSRNDKKQRQSKVRSVMCPFWWTQIYFTEKYSASVLDKKWWPLLHWTWCGLYCQAWFFTQGFSFVVKLTASEKCLNEFHFYANFVVTISNGLSSKVFGRKICPWQYVRTEEGQPISSLRQYKYVACQITWQQSGRVLTEAECVQWKRCRKTLSKQKSIGSFSLSCELCQLQPFNGIFSPAPLYHAHFFWG